MQCICPSPEEMWTEVRFLYTFRWFDLFSNTCLQMRVEILLSFLILLNICFSYISSVNMKKRRITIFYCLNNWSTWVQYLSQETSGTIEKDDLGLVLWHHGKSWLHMDAGLNLGCSTSNPAPCLWPKKVAEDGLTPWAPASKWELLEEASGFISAQLQLQPLCPFWELTSGWKISLSFPLCL